MSDSGWVATFKDGPCSPQRHEFLVDDVLDDLYLMPAPAPREDYVIVGYGEAPEDPWPGQVHYRLDRVDMDEDPDTGEQETTAVYALADLDRWKWMAPSISWETPVPILTADQAAQGYACRICVAREGIRGSDVSSLSDKETVLRHIKEVHS